MPETDTTAAPLPSEPPFLVEHRRDAEASGSFVPSARLVLTPGLRTSGLWEVLPPEELRDLVLLLTFLTPNGWVRPALPELADAMRASPRPCQRSAGTSYTPSMAWKAGGRCPSQSPWPGSLRAWPAPNRPRGETAG